MTREKTLPDFRMLGVAAAAPNVALPDDDFAIDPDFDDAGWVAGFHFERLLDADPRQDY